MRKSLEWLVVEKKNIIVERIVVFLMRLLHFTLFGTLGGEIRDRK